MSEKVIENSELMKEWNYEKNNELRIYPQDVSRGSSKKVWWKCEKGHEWNAVVHTRSKGIGCPYCSGQRAIKGKNDFATLCSDMLKEWDYERNDVLGIKPDELTTGSQKKVNWICPKGHYYTRSIYDRLNGRGHCPFCGNRKVLQGFNDLATTNPELLKEWDYEENDKLGIKPEEITNGGRGKVWWKCEKGHKWDAIIRSRIMGCGCPYCSNNSILKGFNDLATTNPEVLNEWDYEKNRELGITPFLISHGSTKKVWWKCEKGHEYQIPVAQKINKNIKCPICANQQVLKGYNDFGTKHPQLLKEWDYEENDKRGIKPDEIVKGGKIKISWKCEKGHKWETTIAARIRNNKLYNKCPICSSYQRTSIPEKIIYYYVKKVFSKTQANYKPEWLKPKELDIFIPEKNLGIEYDGYYYHKETNRDLEKDKLCKDNNINLIRIREKGTSKINTVADVYYIKMKNSVDYTYVEDALSYLEKYLKVKLNYNISRDFDEIMKLINFMEKENCISKTNPEVLDEWNYKKNEELGVTPYNMSNGSSLKVWWKCEKGHDYLATISTKINQSTGCPYCANKRILVGFNDLATTNPEYLKEWDYEENDKLGITPYMITNGTSTKLHWKCEKGHKWISSLNNRSKGSGCPYCSGRNAVEGKNDFATLYPNMVKEWNYEKNDKVGVYPNQITKGYYKKVWWKCEKGHEWQVSVSSRTARNSKCPYCSSQRVLTGFNDIFTLFPNLVKEWDYEKNTSIPQKMGRGNDKKVWWKCEKGHSYEASPSNRIKGTNCPYCSGNKVLKGFNDIATTNPELLREWNYEKNDKLEITPYNISRSCGKKIWWKCEKGHEYQRTVYNQRVVKKKCPVCKK